MATDVSGCREIVVAGINGLLVPPREVKPLADALGRLLAEPELRQRLGAAGRRLVEENFSAQKVAVETLGLYREMLAARS